MSSSAPLSTKDALRQAKANGEKGKWGKVHPRLLERCDPEVTEKFKVAEGSTVFTIGSCFARNMEEVMFKLGYDVPMLKFRVPKNEWGGRAQGILNKYTPPSIFQEIEWTDRILEKGGTVEFEDCKTLLYQVGEDQWVDGWLGGYVPVDLERAIERRQEIFDVFKNVFFSDCVTITLGLIECWYDQERKTYIQECPAKKPSFLKTTRDSVVFKVLDYVDLVSFIEDAIALIQKRNPNANVLLTVSPVPLDATFTDQDVIIANSYSKSVLRAVAGAVSNSSTKIGYFPSFERVMLTKDWSTYIEDLRHVSDKAVSEIVLSLTSSYLDIPSEKIRSFVAQNEKSWAVSAELSELLQEAQKRKDAGDLKGSAEHYGKAAAVEPNLKKASLHGGRQISALLELGDQVKALEVGEKLLSQGMKTPNTLVPLAMSRFRNGNRAGAITALDQALEMAPNRTDIVNLRNLYSQSFILRQSRRVLNKIRRQFA